MPLDLDKIKSLMAGRTVTEVARAAEMHRPNLSRLLAGRHPDLPVSTIDRLAKALGCRAKDLIQ
jgi:DNA-binding Xre family transcriptional regulator